MGTTRDQCGAGKADALTQGESSSILTDMMYTFILASLTHTTSATLTLDKSLNPLSLLGVIAQDLEITRALARRTRHLHDIEG